SPLATAASSHVISTGVDIGRAGPFPQVAGIMTGRAGFRRDSKYSEIAGIAIGRNHSPVVARRPSGLANGAEKQACPSGPCAGAHQADGVELGLLARVLLGPLAHLVTLVEELDLLHLLERLAERRFRIRGDRRACRGRGAASASPTTPS